MAFPAVENLREHFYYLPRTLILPENFVLSNLGGKVVSRTQTLVLASQDLSASTGTNNNADTLIQAENWSVSTCSDFERRARVRRSFDDKNGDTAAFCGHLRPCLGAWLWLKAFMRA